MKFGYSIFLALYSEVVVTAAAFVPKMSVASTTGSSQQSSSLLRETVEGTKLVPPKKVQELDVKDLYDANVQSTYG